MSSTTALTPQSPLMQPVTWQGQDYFTSQYFHWHYLRQSPYGGKYQRHLHFVRLIRSIDAYDIYLCHGDIVELRWNDLKASNDVGNPILVSFAPLFQAAGWNPLMLLNGTAQLALHERLDDTLSKQVSVAKNTQAAGQMARKSLGLPTAVELSSRDIVAWLEVARVFGTPLHIAQQEGVKMIAATHGVDFRPLLLAAPAQDAIAPDEEMLEPRDLAKKLGLSSAIALNRALEQIGWQVKRIGGDWEPTPAGAPYAARHAWTAEHGAKSGYNTKWKRQAVEEALQSSGLLTPHTQII